MYLGFNDFSGFSPVILKSLGEIEKKTSLPFAMYSLKKSLNSLVNFCVPFVSNVTNLGRLSLFLTLQITQRYYLVVKAAHHLLYKDVFVVLNLNVRMF